MRIRKGYGLGKGQGYKNMMPIDSHIHSLSAKGIKSKVTTLNMMGLATMKRLNEDASRKARNLTIEPFEITSKKEMEKMPPFPFPYIGEDYTPRGWKKVNEYFIDSSGFGADDEMALSIRQFISKIEVGKGYAITSAGQFQVYVSEFEKVSSTQLKRLNAKGKAVVYSKPKMADEITKFVKKLKKKYGDKDDNFVVDTKTEPMSGDVKKSKYIQLRTDSLVYEQLFDPSMSEQPYLIRDANKEFGGKMKVPTGYEDQEAFGKMLKKHGWDYEMYGQGIIEIYKQD